MESRPLKWDCRPVLTAAAVCGFFLAAAVFGSQVSMEDAQKVAASAKQWSQSHLVLATLAVVVVQLLSGLTAVPTKGVATLVAGALVGPLLAATATVSGIAMGTTILFFVTRRLLRDYVQQRLGPRLAWVQERLSRRPIWSMIALRLMITLPYGPITMAAALSRVRYRDFVAGSLVGDLPVVILYSVAGSRLEVLVSSSDVVDPWTASLLIAAALVMLASVFLGKGRTVDSDSAVT
jgi:uncharacterized membrane protein YdjX (TVP38/TMEM64 family)